MALKIRIPRLDGKQSFSSLLLRVVLLAIAAVALVALIVIGWFYFKYERIVDDRLKQPIFANTAKIYAAPREVRPGQKLTVRLIANEVREAGYSADGASPVSPLGTFSQGVQTITVHPGPQSYHAQDSAVRIAYECHQMLAAMGMTLEHPLHLWTYRLKALVSELGGRSGQAASVAEGCFNGAADTG